MLRSQGVAEQATLVSKQDGPLVYGAGPLDLPGASLSRLDLERGAVANNSVRQPSAMRLLGHLSFLAALFVSS